jgi:hypothetical protein
VDAPGYSDAVPLEACRSDGLYTEALYKSLLKRLGSGQYSRRYLARCLGVSVETIKKLNKRLGIKRVPQYDILAPLTPAVWAELAAGDEHQRAGHLLVSPRADGSYRRHALSSASALMKANRLAYLAAHAPAFYDVEGTFSLSPIGDSPAAAAAAPVLVKANRAVCATDPVTEAVRYA